MDAQAPAVRTRPSLGGISVRELEALWSIVLDARAPPGQVWMQGFDDVPEPDAASRPGWYDQI